MESIDQELKHSSPTSLFQILKKQTLVHDLAVEIFNEYRSFCVYRHCGEGQQEQVGLFPLYV